MSFCGYTGESAELSTVTAVEELTEDASQPRPSIVLRRPAAGECLWDIAKRYRVSCDSLKRMNPDLQDGVAGQQVILWHRQE